MKGMKRMGEEQGEEEEQENGRKVSEKDLEKEDPPRAFKQQAVHAEHGVLMAGACSRDPSSHL